MDTKKISVQTPWGKLTACIGGDGNDYQDIFVYMEREDGVEIDLVAVSLDVDKNELSGYVWEDTSTDEWTRKFTWSQEEINIEEEI